ncbi:MAG: hypothetical protein R2780_03995 [Crocinitomicaceae bacterium]
MKALIPSLFVFPLLFSCGSGEEEVETESSNQTEETVNTEEVVVSEVENKILLGSEVCGNFIIGKTVPDLPKGLKIRHFTKELNNGSGSAMEETHNVIFSQLEDVVELIMDQGSNEHHDDRLIKEMIVLSNYYHTDDSIAVGSTIEDLKYTYADHSFFYSGTENKYYAESPLIPKVEFIFSEDDVKKKVNSTAEKTQISASAFKDGAKITKIRIY